MKIVELHPKNEKDINKANEPFEIIGRLCPSFINNEWIYQEELYSKSFTKQYPNEEFKTSDYLRNSDNVFLLAYLDEKCVGQIVLKKDWNKYAFVEDICVAKVARGQGVGTALILRAVEWAKEKGLSGLALETQDTNLLACRFYRKCGFKIGAVNTMLYKNFDKPYADEVAIFWYMKFEE